MVDETYYVRELIKQKSTRDLITFENKILEKSMHFLLVENPGKQRVVKQFSKA